MFMQGVCLTMYVDVVLVIRNKPAHIMKAIAECAVCVCGAGQGAGQMLGPGRMLEGTHHSLAGAAAAAAGSAPTW